MSATTVGFDDWRAGGAWFDHAAGPIFTRSDGRGSALVLIHGFPTASWDWAKIWLALTAEFRCHTLDMIGFGFSAKPKNVAYSIQTQADLFEDFLAAQRVDEYAIIAHDYGDTVAQELLARHNDGRARQRLIRLVLLNGGLFPETHRPRLIQTLLAGPLGGWVARLTTRRTFAANLRGICARPLSDEEIDGMWRLLVENDGIAVLPKLIGYMAERRLHRERWVGALQKSRVPIRLINGLDDPISGVHMVARYRELVGAADVIELPGVGHYPQVEAPNEVARAALEFLRRQ